MERNGTRARFGIQALLIAAFALGMGACAVEGDAGIESEDLHGADESGAGVQEITARYAAGTRLQTTANLNLRTSGSTSSRIILVMPNGSIVTLDDNPGPVNGWYRVRYGSHEGYAYGQYLRLAPTSGGGGGGGGGASNSASVDGAISRARAGVGFSYWWGHGRWRAEGPSSSTRGSCSGSCPSCSHSGSYGADCSGYVAKIWQVPGSNSVLSNDSHPYSTWDFAGGTGGGQWARISRGSARRGDAMVYNSGGAGHIFLVESGDPWGSMWAYEARGCSYGIVHNIRTASSSYAAIRRRGY